jgi:hypothetical protein
MSSLSQAYHHVSYSSIQYNLFKIGGEGYDSTFDNPLCYIINIGQDSVCFSSKVIDQCENIFRQSEYAMPSKELTKKFRRAERDYLPYSSWIITLLILSLLLTIKLEIMSSPYFDRNDENENYVLTVNGRRLSFQGYESSMII